jgi:hypothetical protein
VAQIDPRALGSLFSHLAIRRATVEVFYLASTRDGVILKSKSKSKSKRQYDRQSVGHSVLVSGAHLGPATNLSFSLRFSFRQLRFVIL